MCGYFTAVARGSRHASSQQGAEHGQTQQQQFSSHGVRSSQILGEKKVFAGSVEDEGRGVCSLMMKVSAGLSAPLNALTFIPSRVVVRGLMFRN